MTQLTISEMARQARVRASTIRYYERIGVLSPAMRVGRQRRYDMAAVRRLALVRRAQEAGFSLTEIRTLLFGFPPSIPVSARWKALASRKISELEGAIEKIRTMKELLERIESRCGCDTVEQCGARILERNDIKGTELPSVVEAGRSPRANRLPHAPP